MEKSYYKRPWFKWVSLALALLQIWTLKTNIQDYIINTSAGIFSPPELQKYAVAKEFGCVMNVLLITLFLGEFLISVLAKSSRQQTNGNCTVLIIMAAELLLSLIILRPPMVGMGILWAVFSALTLLLTIYDVYHFFCEKKKMQAKENSQQTE